MLILQLKHPIFDNNGKSDWKRKLQFRMKLRKDCHL